MVVNVANSIIAGGSTSLEVLEKAPGVTVEQQNGTLQLRRQMPSFIPVISSSRRHGNAKSVPKQKHNGQTRLRLRHSFHTLVVGSIMLLTSTM